jgi:NAD(P)-dependent dehydrogenase (short-subunit alcohol dehydrogenase family)
MDGKYILITGGTGGLGTSVTRQAAQGVTPESLAQVICFLASEAAQDIRGAAVPVYGNL